MYIALFAALLLTVPTLGGAGEALADGRARKAKSDRESSKRAKKVRRAARRARARRARRRRIQRRKRRRKVKICRRRRGKRRCRWVRQFSGHAVRRGLRTEPLPRPSGDIRVYAVNFKEEVEVNIYDDNGGFDEAALAELDNNFRCRRTGDTRAVDPRLYEILSIIYDHFGQRRIELISGFRNQLNRGSRHFHASAMDIRIPGVPTRKLYEFATSLDGGNMGIGRYPNSGFVHIDFRAPGEKSYRWIDFSGPSKKRKRRKRRRRHNT